jgi:thymidylate kinase
MTNHSKLVVFEGVDGSGKSTLINKCADKLREMGKTVEVLNFPRDRAVLHAEDPIMHILNEMVIERGNHLKRKDPPDFLLYDRYWISTMVYQISPAFLKNPNFSVMDWTWEGVIRLFQEILPIDRLIFCNPPEAEMRENFSRRGDDYVLNMEKWREFYYKYLELVPIVEHFVKTSTTIGYLDNHNVKKLIEYFNGRILY